jgi:hypothetical protein
MKKSQMSAVSTGYYLYVQGSMAVRRRQQLEVS